MIMYIHIYGRSLCKRAQVNFSHFRVKYEFYRKFCAAFSGTTVFNTSPIIIKLFDSAISH